MLFVSYSGAWRRHEFNATVSDALEDTCGSRLSSHKRTLSSPIRQVSLSARNGSPRPTSCTARRPCRHFGDVGECAFENGAQGEAVQPLHLGGAGDERSVRGLLRAVDDEACARQRLERVADGAIGVEVVRPSGP
jgi:hypothetical protein